MSGRVNWPRVVALGLWLLALAACVLVLASSRPNPNEMGWLVTCAAASAGLLGLTDRGRP